MNRIGISDMAFYVPPLRMGLERILELRGSGDPAMKRRLERAVESTGQKAMRFPASWDDTVSMAATAARRVLSKQSKAVLESLRYLVAGTETTMDFSKPVSSWVHGMLSESGIPMPEHLANFQVQHACAAGTLGFLSVAGLLSIPGQSADRGLVVCSDIARYECPSTAEITQGAGAAALLVDSEARLLGFDLASMGFSSHHVDDFFRPLDSITARVRGQYSMQCYHQAAESAFNDYAQRSGQTPVQALQNHDFLVFHVPFARMAYTAARHLLAVFGGLMDGEIDQNLKDRGFFEALETTAETGNTYSASVWFNLAATLKHQHRILGDRIVGKKVLLSSYGSGNIMVVLSATIGPGAPAILEAMDLAGMTGKGIEASMEEYMSWISRSHSTGPDSSPSLIPSGGLFHLTGIRDDGWREYAFRDHA